MACPAARHRAVAEPDAGCAGILRAGADERQRHRRQCGAGLDGGGNPCAHQGARACREVGPYAGGQVTTGGRVGLLGDKDFMETPFNTISYTDKFIADRQARDITDVISATDPTVFSNGQTGTINEFYYIRGFASAIGDVSFGGLYGISPYYRVSPEMFERIDVLKGPSALLNGMPPGGSVGGSVNLVPKRAGDDPLARLTAPICPTRSSAPTWTWAGASATTGSSASASTACTATAKARSTTRSTSRSWVRWAWTGAASAPASRPTSTAAKTTSRARRAASAWRPASPCPSRPGPTRC